MTIYPFQLNEMMHVYGKFTDVKRSDALDREPGEPQDVVSISDKARKQRTQDEANPENNQQVRNTR